MEQADSDNSVCDSAPTSDAGKVTAEAFRAEQTNDESLKRCWVMADRGKGGFII